MLQRMIGYVVQSIVHDAGQTRFYRQGSVKVKRCHTCQAYSRSGHMKTVMGSFSGAPEGF